MDAIHVPWYGSAPKNQVAAKVFGANGRTYHGEPRGTCVPSKWCAEVCKCVREHVDIACLFGQPFCRRRYRSIYFDFKVSHVTAHRVARTVRVTSVGHLLDYYSYYLTSSIIFFSIRAIKGHNIDWKKGHNIDWKMTSSTKNTRPAFTKVLSQTTFTCFELKRLISHPSYPQVWCFAGEDLQKRVQQLAQASVKGNTAASAVCKIVRHYRLAMQIATMEHEEDLWNIYL